MDKVKEFKKFIGSISKSDKVVLIYDKDADGVPAAAIAKLTFSRTGIESKAVPGDRANIENLIGELHHLKPSHVIFFDISAESFSEVFREFPKTKFMVLDHHKKLASPRKVLVIKPRDLKFKEDPSQYPVAKMSYDLFSKVANISKFKWIACVGVISDAAYPTWKSFVDPVLKAKGWEAKDIFETIPSKIASIVNSSNAIHESRITEAMDLMLAGSPRKILKSDLAKLESKVMKEVNKKVSQHKRAEFLLNNKLIIYEIKSKYKIAGRVANLVSRSYPNSLLLVLEPSRGWMKVTSRCPSGTFPANDIMVKSAKDLEGSSAGGHKPAAGAFLREEDTPKFKRRVISEVKRLLK